MARQVPLGEASLVGSLRGLGFLASGLRETVSIQDTAAECRSHDGGETGLLRLLKVRQELGGLA